MPSTIYAHLTWTTIERRPLLDLSAATYLRDYLPRVASRYAAHSLAVGIVQDHVHLLLNLPAVIDIPRLVQGLKGASARALNRDKPSTADKLRWARGYDLRSVSPRALVQAISYVNNQAQRHPTTRIVDQPDVHGVARPSADEHVVRAAHLDEESRAESPRSAANRARGRVLKD